MKKEIRGVQGTFLIIVTRFSGVPYVLFVTL